ncbi:hypothetical protein, partial [Phyllobacterium sp. P5_D12]
MYAALRFSKTTPYASPQRLSKRALIDLPGLTAINSDHKTSLEPFKTGVELISNRLNRLVRG